METKKEDKSALQTSQSKPSQTNQSPKTTNVKPSVKSLSKPIPAKLSNNPVTKVKNMIEKHPILTQKWSLSEKASDKLTSFIGSWSFIILFVVYVAVWISLNIYAWVNHWDPYPFILLNLTLSVLAAIQAPIILMAQNRQNQKESLRAQYDYQIDRKAERGIQQIILQLKRIERKISKNQKLS